MTTEPPSALSRVWAMLKSLHFNFYIALFVNVLNCLLDLLPEIILGLAISTVSERENSWLGRIIGCSSIDQQFWVLGILIVSCYAIQAVVDYYYCTLWWGFNQKVQHALRPQLLEKVLGANASAFSKEKLGNISSILNEDVSLVGHFFEDTIDMIIELFTSTFFTTIYLFTVSTKIAFISLFPIPFIILTTHLFHKKLSPLYLDIRQSAGMLSSRVSNGIIGFSTIKSLSTESTELKNVKQKSKHYMDVSIKAQKLVAYVGSITRILIMISFISTLLYGGYITVKGDLDIGIYTSVVFLANRIFVPFKDLAEIMVDCQKLFASCKRLLTIDEIEKERNDGVSTKISGLVTFENVSFSYNHSSRVLRYLNFTLKPGKTYAFVGETGSGKSTLTKLILGMYNLDEGKILIDNISLDEINLHALRKQISVVSQDIFIFDGTIQENIAYSLNNISDSDIIGAAKKAAIHDFILSLPNGYSTVLEERGNILSGGQKQRFAIARALLRRPKILILDEATSALDNETELIIQNTMNNLDFCCTRIIIAHRLSTIKDADTIFVMDNGKIIEKGTHQDLLTLNGKYGGFLRKS